jgi:hypothetical protein
MSRCYKQAPIGPQGGDRNDANYLWEVPLALTVEDHLGDFRWRIDRYLSTATNPILLNIINYLLIGRGAFDSRKSVFSASRASGFPAT